MPDEGGLLRLEGDVAEHVVGMHVGVDDILDRQRRARADGGEKTRADARAAAGIDHGDAVAPDDEAGVGDVALVARREQLVASLVHENAGRDFAHNQRLGR